MIDPLSRAAIRYGSDKFGGHAYTPVYHRLFGHLRDKPIRLLEIGIGGYGSEHAGGLSLRMWAEYFPYAQITGLDIEKKTLALPPRVRVVQGSQSDDALLARLSQDHGPFDIVIDDGSHVVSHMIGTFRTLYPLLAPEGIYVVEDTQTSFMPSVGGNPEGSETIFSVAHRVGLAMHRLEGYAPEGADEQMDQFGAMTESIAIHRNIVVFQRGDNSLPSNSQMNLTTPAATRMYQLLQDEGERNPSPGSILSRIDMLIWAGDTQEAGRLALLWAERYPSDAPLLYELLRMMEWAKLPDQREQIAARIAVL